MPVAPLHQSQWRGIRDQIRLQRRCRRQRHLPRPDELVDDLIRLHPPRQPPLRRDLRESREQPSERAIEDRRQRLLPPSRQRRQSLRPHLLAAPDHPPLVVRAPQHPPHPRLRLLPTRSHPSSDLPVPRPRHCRIAHHPRQRRMLHQLLALPLTQLSRQPRQQPHCEATLHPLHRGRQHPRLLLAVRPRRGQEQPPVLPRPRCCERPAQVPQFPRGDPRQIAAHRVHGPPRVPPLHPETPGLQQPRKREPLLPARLQRRPLHSRVIRPHLRHQLIQPLPYPLRGVGRDIYIVRVIILPLAPRPLHVQTITVQHARHLP